jgi:predicted flap endonuclease-1-like 5' DNA nuclease
MVRKQVYLTAEQDTRLRRVAKQQQRSEAEVLRDALDRYLPGTAAQAPVDGDALLRLVGIGRSAEGTLSESVDDILYGGGGA